MHALLNGVRLVSSRDHNGLRGTCESYKTAGMNKPRKRSVAMTLVLIGATTSGCSMEDSRPLQRDVYNSFAECTTDWGDDGQACEPNVEGVAENATATTGTTSTTGSGYRYRTVYYGPGYQPGYRPTTIQTNRGNHTVGTSARETRTVASGSARSAGRASQGGRVSRGGFGGSSASRGASS
jgi:hypothetical protein